MELSDEGNQQGVQTRIDDDGVIVPVNGRYLMTVPVRVEAGEAVISEPSSRNVLIEVTLGSLVESGAVFSEPSEVPGALAEELVSLRQTVRLLRRAPVTHERLNEILRTYLRARLVGLAGLFPPPPGSEPEVVGIPESIAAIMSLFSPSLTTEDQPPQG